MADRVRPYTQLGTDVVASHTTAALLHGIPLPGWARRTAQLHLTPADNGPQPRRRGVAGHQASLDQEDRTLVGGVPATALARTWLDLAPWLALDDLVAAADHLVCEHRHGDRTDREARLPLPELRDYVASARGVRGLAKARTALELVRVGVDSVPETKMRLILARAGLPEFVPDFPVMAESGGDTVWADLGCSKYRVCGEYEGGHHATPKQQAFDRRRDALTAERGWLQVKIFNADMRLGEQWVAGHFIQALSSRGWPG